MANARPPRVSMGDPERAGLPVHPNPALPTVTLFHPQVATPRRTTMASRVSVRPRGDPRSRSQVVTPPDPSITPGLTPDRKHRRPNRLAHRLRRRRRACGRRRQLLPVRAASGMPEAER